MQKQLLKESHIMRSLAIVVALGLLSSGSAVFAKRDRNAVPEARETGKPVDCIQTTQIRESQVHSDRVIDFRTSGKKWYRNTLPYSCPSLGFEERFAYRTSINRLCSVDVITVLQSPGLSRGASCGLGKFQPIELIKK
jgi:hypothetical protein